MTAILGISAFYHDSAATLVVDGEIVAAAQEERFSRKKHDDRFPVNAVNYCLQEAGLTAADLSYVGYYEKPLAKFDRLLETYLSFAPSGFASFRQAIPIWLKQKLFLPREIRRGLRDRKHRRYVFVEHHESHAASAFFPSPFDEAAILTLDGVGEWATAAIGVGRGHEIELTHEMRFPHSLGMLYSAFTYYTGFTVNSGEYKLMGLAPYGEPRFVDLILRELIDLKEDGSFWMDMSYFNYCQGLTMTSGKFHDLFGGPPRKPDTLLTQRDMDIAASIQRVAEEIILRAARHTRTLTGLSNLCLAGGVALNCVANSKVLLDAGFDRIWIQPAAGDAGGALGTALFIWHQLLQKPRTAHPLDSQRASLLGPAFSDDDIAAFLEGTGTPYSRASDDADLCDQMATAIAGGAVVGWFQGRMEFGPRALGSRSLLGDPRRAEMQTVMNMKVKFREGFRPFAPSALAEHAGGYFETREGVDSPYMLLVFPVAADKRRALDEDGRQARGIEKLKIERSEIPSVTHVDYSARLQTVDAARNPLYHRVISAFHAKTGCPLVVNTSFNLGWEPIVCAPRDAFETFMSSDIDVLAMGRCIVRKTQQPAWVSEAVAEPGLDPVLASIWCSPCCEAELRVEPGALVCERCESPYSTEGGIPRLIVADDSGGDSSGGNGIRRAADRHESVRALLENSRRDPYLQLLNESIPYNTTVLDACCGGGELTAFLGISCRRVVGTDLSAEAVTRADAFKREHNLPRVRFVQMNAARPAFRAGSFDVVLWNGEAAASGDAGRTFASLVRLVRPGGHLVATAASGASARDLIRWTADTGLEFIRGHLPGAEGMPRGGLFHRAPLASGTDSAVARLQRMFSGGRGAGAFVVVARRPAAGPGAPIASDAAYQLESLRA